MYARNPEIIETELQSELMLLHPDTGEMFSLNDTGRRVWRSLPCDSPARLGAELSAVLAVDVDVAERDVRALLNDLHRSGLIRHSATESLEG